MTYLIIIVITAAVIAFCRFENNKIDITEYNINDDRISGQVKIAQLSDLHSKPFKGALKKLENESPDIIVITGDYINDKGKRKNEMMKYAKNLLQIAPVYYITGNHEHRLDYFDSLMDELRCTGFTVLLDEVAQTTINGTKISILGLDENQASFDDYKARRNGTFKYRNMRPEFDKLSKCEGFKIVLSHYPENFEAVKELNYSQYDFDIQLSGHAHGGQFILPFIGPVFSPGQGLFPKYARGSFGKRPKLIVSRGLGNAEFPLRLFNHPEINIINLKPNKKPE